MSTSSSATRGTQATGTDPYLVVKTGSFEGRKFPLVPGQMTTIGRAPTNRIPIPDEVCSRNHCEVFQSGGRWMIRDLGSRNGTRVQGQYIEGDSVLLPGHIIQLGSTQIWFTYEPLSTLEETNTVRNLESETSTDLPVHMQPEILHRTRQSRFRTAEAHTRDRMARDLARLYRLAIDMGAAPDPQRLSELVLDALLATSPADIGAVLLAPELHAQQPPVPSQLQVVVYKSRTPMTYQRVSDSLSHLTIQERDAILARDIQADVRLNKKDSVHEISAQSVICAPIRYETTLFGLIHLYATDPNRALEEEDLEFTLAVADQLAVALENLQHRDELAVDLARAETENRTLREQLRIETELVGDSPSMNRLRERLGRIAPTDATVLIRGESGVGKELVARAIHLNSNRRNGPFITMNCAALSESLLESELFGHEKGSFTGAVNRKLGKFEQADGGTLFLDEVGEMSPSIQAKFLRILEGHPFERVGGGTQIRVDVRVVAATNRALEDAVNEGAFRKDLYFRLQVVELTVEPLRDRRTDIGKLARHFLERFARKIGRTVVDFTPAATDALTHYDWPGNVRELQNTIERAVILSSGPVLGPADLQLSALGAPPMTLTGTHSEGAPFRAVTLDQLEQEHIAAMLEFTNRNKSQASHLLGIERSTLDRKLKRYEIDRKRQSR